MKAFGNYQPAGCVLLFATLMAGPVPADVGVPAAIGRIAYAASPAPGAAICTGTLIAADLVLTAGHCIAAGADPGGVWFQAGQGAAGALATARGVTVLRPPAAAPDAGALPRLAADLALLRIAPPVPPEVALALPLVPPPAPGSTASFIGYDRGGSDAPRRSGPCPVSRVEADIITLFCGAVSGNSGAPLLVETPGGWAVAGVVVARSNNNGAFAVATGFAAAALAAR